MTCHKKLELINFDFFITNEIKTRRLEWCQNKTEKRKMECVLLECLSIFLNIFVF